MKNSLKETVQPRTEKEFKHPELQKGEIFLGNFSKRNFLTEISGQLNEVFLMSSQPFSVHGKGKSGFESIERKSKRMGHTAYDIKGKELNSINNLFPVFVKAEEIQNAYKESLEKGDKESAKIYKNQLEKSGYKIEK